MSENVKNAVNVTCQGIVTFSSRESTCQHMRDSGSISGSGRPLKVEMATCSSILAWRIQWTEVPSGLTVHGVASS